MVTKVITIEKALTDVDNPEADIGTMTVTYDFDDVERANTMTIRFDLKAVLEAEQTVKFMLPGELLHVEDIIEVLNDVIKLIKS